MNEVINNNTDLNVRILLSEKNRHDVLKQGILFENLNQVLITSYSPDIRVSIEESEAAYIAGVDQEYRSSSI